MVVTLKVNTMKRWTTRSNLCPGLLRGIKKLLTRWKRIKGGKGVLLGTETRERLCGVLNMLLLGLETSDVEG